MGFFIANLDNSRFFTKGVDFQTFWEFGGIETVLSCKDPRFMSSIFSICYLNSKLLHAPPGFLMFLGAAKIQDMKNPAETALRVSQLDVSYIYIYIYTLIHRIII